MEFSASDGFIHKEVVPLLHWAPAVIWQCHTNPVTLLIRPLLNPRIGLSTLYQGKLVSANKKYPAIN